MGVSMDKDKHNEKLRLGPSTKYDHFKRVFKDKNEENEKRQLRDHPQNMTT